MQGEGKEIAGIYLISHNYLPHTQQIQGAVMTISTTLTYTTFYIQNIYRERNKKETGRGTKRDYYSSGWREVNSEDGIRERERESK